MKILLLLVTLCVLLPSQEMQKLTLQLQWKHQFESAGFYAAKEKDFYASAGLDVEFREFESGMNITKELLSGKVDYATSYSSIILEYLNGEPITLIANFFKHSPIVLLAQEEIKTPRDLVGKRVMGVVDTARNTALLRMLDRFNVEADDFINIPRKFAIDSFVNKEIDAMSAFVTNEIYEISKHGVKYNIFNPSSFGINFYDINLFTSKKELQNNPKRVEAFRLASIKGWEYAMENQEEIVELILKKYNTSNKSKDALLFEAKQIEYLMLANVYPVGSVDIGMIKTIADSYKQAKLTKSVSSFDVTDFVYLPRETPIVLTQEEQSYLRAKKKLRMCVDPNWMPVEMIENGRHIGIAANFMQLVSQKIEMPFELVDTKSWAESLESIKNRECDFLPSIVETPNRKEYLDFTTPYIQTPLVVATKIGVPFENDLKKLQNKKLGVVKNYFLFEILKEKYPGINLVEVESVHEGIKQVEDGKIFGFLDNAIVVNHEIQKESYESVAISGQFKELYLVSIGTRSDEPILHEIMQKVLLSFDKELVKEIVGRWTNISYRVKTDYELFVKVLFGVLVAIGVFSFWYFRLKKEMEKKEIAQKRLQKTKKQLQELNSTLERRVQGELKRNFQQQVLLIHQNKLAQIGEIIQNIAHQWRQPLAQINSCVLMIDGYSIKQGKKLDEKVVSKLNEIELLTSYMSKTIEDFQSFFNPQKEKKVFLLSRLLDDILKILGGTFESLNIEIERDFSKHITIHNYKKELEHVLIIILNNAKDALVQTKTEKPKITVRASEHENVVFVEVYDNAGGIKEENLEKVFDPYFTTKHKSQGTGLGLYMAKMITQKGLEGELNVCNKQEGASFQVILKKETNE